MVQLPSEHDEVAIGVQECEAVLVGVALIVEEGLVV